MPSAENASPVFRSGGQAHGDRAFSENAATNRRGSTAATELIHLGGTARVNSGAYYLRASMLS